VITLILLLMTSLLLRKEESGTLRSDLGAGVLWGIATAFKPYAFIYFPYFLIKKKWRCLGFGILSLGFAFVFPALFYGWTGNLKVHEEWLSP